MYRTAIQTQTLFAYGGADLSISAIFISWLRHRCLRIALSRARLLFFICSPCKSPVGKEKGVRMETCILHQKLTIGQGSPSRMTLWSRKGQAMIGGWNERRLVLRHSERGDSKGKSPVTGMTAARASHSYTECCLLINTPFTCHMSDVAACQFQSQIKNHHLFQTLL